MTPHPACLAAIDTLLREHAAALLAQADTVRSRSPRNAAICERQAMSLGLAAGYLRSHLAPDTFPKGHTHD